MISWLPPSLWVCDLVLVLELDKILHFPIVKHRSRELFCILINQESPPRPSYDNILLLMFRAQNIVFGISIQTSPKVSMGSWFHHMLFLHIIIFYHPSHLQRWRGKKLIQQYILKLPKRNHRKIIFTIKKE